MYPSIRIHPGAGSGKPTDMHTVMTLSGLQTIAQSIMNVLSPHEGIGLRPFSHVHRCTYDGSPSKLPAETY
eukprot:scaffold1518_cov417-Prasinococcus_capsulatus_cf.AAC.35